MIERTMSCLGPHGFYRMAYAVWPGPRGGPVVMCVHGLTRNGRDFDKLAGVLSKDATVICPDMAGRGHSDWLADAADYAYPTYMAACAALIARLELDNVLWVGTSMGGLVAIFLAALPGMPIRRLVLNDIGPFVPASGLKRLADYVGSDPSFADMAALEADLRKIAAPFGKLGDDEWRDLASTSARRKPGGGFGYAYDPRIGDALRASEPKDVDLWATWAAMNVPTLVLRGANSDILRHEDAVAMTERGPRARLVEIPGVGHAPALMAREQTALVRDFLLA